MRKTDCQKCGHDKASHFAETRYDDFTKEMVTRLFNCLCNGCECKAFVPERRK